MLPVVRAKGLRPRLLWAVQLGSSGRCLASAGLVCWVKGQASATGEPRDKYRAAPETKAFARTILRAGDRPTARPWCSMLSEQPQHRTTSLPPRRRAAGAGFVASVNQQRKCRSAATDAMAIEVKAFIRLSLSDQPFNGGGPNNLDQWEPVIRRSALIGQATEAKTYGSKAGPRICEVSLRPKRNLPVLAPLLPAQPFQNLLIAFRPLDH